MSNISRTPTAAGTARYELRYPHLFEAGHGFVFPCDAQGHVAVDELSERAQRSYRETSARVGTEYEWPHIERRS
jgi:hypothetical protein